MSINPLGGPINYTATMPDLTQAFTGFNAALQDLGQMRQADALRQQYAADLQSTLANPTQQAWAALIAKYPQQREAFAKSAELYGKEKMQNEFWQGMEVSNALENGNPDVAKAKLTELVAARKNSGQPAGIYEQVLSALDNGNIQGAQGATNMALSMLDPDAFQKALKNKVEAGTTEAQIQEAKAKANKTEAEASSAATAAKFAESKAVMDLRMSDEQIKKWAADTEIARQNSRIAAMNAAAAREGNALKRQELQLKINDAIDQRDEKLRTKASEVAAAHASMDNMLNTAQRILNTDPSIIERATGPVASKTPTLRAGTADFEALVETLGAQSFIAQIPSLKGTGSLSNAEGEKLQAALQNLSLKQSPERLVANVKEAVRLIEKARNNVSQKYGLPNSAPDVPAGVKKNITVDY